MKKRVTAKKLKLAADLAREKGVRVQIGDYVIDPPGKANDAAGDEAAEIQRKIDALASGRGT